MYWNRRADLRAGGFWRCAVANRASNKAWRQAHVEYRRVKLREWNDAHRDHKRAYIRKFRYGVTAAEFAALLEKQGGRCALCGVEFADRSGRTLHVDHDHATNRIRGLLCLRCNTAMERAEVPGWLDRVAAYLAD